MPTRSTEVAVVGLGAMGSMALWRLARRGVRCTGFEQFRPGHGLGSSTGDTRIFRTAYFEAPAYVPLLLAALPLWRELEAETGAALLTLTGGLMIGPPEGRIVAGTLSSVREHGLEHRVLDAGEAGRLHRRHVLEPDEVAVWEPRAGFVRPELAVSSAAARAADLGAELVLETRVEALEPAGDGFRISTAAGEWTARHLILSAGAWVTRFAPGLPLVVERAVQGWYGVDEPADFAPARFPIFIQDVGATTRYGIPSTDGSTIKVAGHGGGGAADPDHLDRDTHPADWSETAEFIRARLRGVTSTPTRLSVCMYTNSPDQHFVLGALRELSGAVLVSACSGHGFKFAPVLGEVAAGLALGEAVPYDLEAFSPDRLAMRSVGG